MNWATQIAARMYHLRRSQAVWPPLDESMVGSPEGDASVRGSAIDLSLAWGRARSTVLRPVRRARQVAITE
jgi:hypothetical protein